MGPSRGPKEIVKLLYPSNCESDKRSDKLIIDPRQPACCDDQWSLPGVADRSSRAAVKGGNRCISLPSNKKVATKDRTWA